jgi:hypothetical protein
MAKQEDRRRNDIMGGQESGPDKGDAGDSEESGLYPAAFKRCVGEEGRSKGRLRIRPGGACRRLEDDERGARSKESR